MTNYYATAFRQGSYPSITEDQIYLWARPHPKNADASDDPVAKPTSYQLVSGSFQSLSNVVVTLHIIDRGQAMGRRLCHVRRDR